ncbi:helix-turn-helix transcriptional regulator [Amycolatopsis cihanbeyliensis]|uniref:Helix-turn-helix protein n=1 Tax=Amycolatopsis cihanbeyliensis TaxID=1128664 RepID=A0A542CUL7_AMYCI|nr:helix-turn-helix transcriptional regulator [Amycolatopsis cihanbeyliensis]TQI94501.1 helix-turn-helix protein [Amycolatopsis cihanbeyliensis]
MVDNALGGFLRARREAIAPSAAGFPSGPRRRTPGLRRGELATLAGISVEYLTRLERGRDRHPSGQVLGALADALGLSPEERVHLHRLVKASDGGGCAQSAPPRPEPRPTVRALLDRMEPTPALIVDAQGDVLASNTGFRLLAGPVGLLDTDPPNLARFVFTHPNARVTFPDWDRVADDRAAALRAAGDLGDHAAAALAEELSVTAGTEFTRRFAASAVLPAWTGVERWRHPRYGTVDLAYENLALAGTEEHRLLVYLPTDTATADPLAGDSMVPAAGHGYA